MAKWECIVCGWVYDEAKGDPESGVPAGTPWAQVPDDWLCPDCGVGKEDFSLIPEAAAEPVPHHDEVASAVDLAKAPLVVIGSGLAGYAVVKEFRKHDSDTPLIVITADDGRSYSKPMLSTGFTKQHSANDLAQVDAGTLGKQFNASVWSMTRVKSIDISRQLVKLGDAETAIHYSKLVLALGADTITPPIDGNAQDHVYAINDLLDYADFRRALERNKAKKVVLIGAGLIGCEFANDLINGGFEVEAVDPLGYCLPGLLPEVAGKAVQRALEDLGARFHFGSLVTAVNQKPDGEGVVVSLNNGESLLADMVVSAVGVRPRTALAKAAGIACNRGIITNRLLETSATAVYALGDCAEVEGHVLVYVAPLMAAARALGQTLAGKPTPVVYPAMPVTIKTPVCPVVVNPPPAGEEGNWQIEQEDNNVVAEFRGSGGDLLGFALTGEGIKQKMRLQKELPPLLT